MTNLKIKTKGMHCPSCEMLLKNELEDLPGVDKAEASFKSGIISVDFDERKTDKKDIIATIKTEGFMVE